MIGVSATEVGPTEAVQLDFVEEVITIDKRVVETGHVRVRTLVDDEVVRLTDIVNRGAVEVERVAIGTQIAVAPGIREDGDYLIIPIVEERLVVEKRMFLVEEVRVRRTTVAVPVELKTTRRVMRVEIERNDAAHSSGSL